MISNASEDLVEMLLQEILRKEPDLIKCKCDICLDNIRALTLNNIPTKYYSSAAGSTFVNFSNFETQNKTNAMSELMRAIKLVNANPRH